ncbi:MAG: hypothetical protein ABIA11_04280 [Patescibacteria group bacterium]
MDVIKTLKNNPLIDLQSTLEGDSLSDVTWEGGGALYFGTGLTTSTDPSIAIPFDLVGMICTAIEICKAAELDQAIQLIADTHALSNSFCNEKDVRAISQQMMDTASRISNLVRSDLYTPLLSSDIDKSKAYRTILSSIQTDDHEYVKREWSDIEYLRRIKGLKIKLSWTIGSKEKRIGFDERLYDNRFEEVVGSKISFIYLKPGRTLDLHRPKVSPYISIEGERRILLQPKENVRAKIEEAQKSQDAELKSVIKHMADIVSVFENTYGKEVKGSDAIEKTQSIIDLVFES